MINVFQPQLGEDELKAIEKVFKSNWLGKGQLTKQFETMRTQMKSIMSMDEEQMEKVSKGQAPMPQMKAAKPKKGKGKNKGGFRF